MNWKAELFHNFWAKTGNSGNKDIWERKTRLGSRSKSKLVWQLGLHGLLAILGKRLLLTRQPQTTKISTNHKYKRTDAATAILFVKLRFFKNRELYQTLLPQNSNCGRELVQKSGVQIPVGEGQIFLSRFLFIFIFSIKN